MSRSEIQHAELGVGDVEKDTAQSTDSGPQLKFTGVNSRDEETGVVVGIRNGVPAQAKKTKSKKYVWPLWPFEFSDSHIRSMHSLIC